MKKLILKAALLLATTLALPMSAHAVVVWNWSWRGTDIGSGTLTTDDLSVGSYLITDMTGKWNTANITGLLSVGTKIGGTPIDNRLLDLPTQLTQDGLGFTTGAVNVALYTYPEYFAYSESSSTSSLISNRAGVFTATQVAAVPEPETYALMLAGLALVGAAARRRRARA